MISKQNTDKKNIRAAIYIRLPKKSAAGQEQEDILRHYALERGIILQDVFVDGKQNKGWQKLLQAAQSRLIDSVIIWHYKQLGTSLATLALAVGELDRLGIGLISLSQKIDTGDPSGQFFYQTVADLALLERESKCASVKLGLARARASGIRLGRPEKDPGAQKRIVELREKGLTMRQIAHKEKLSTSGVFKILRRAAG